MNIRRDRPKGEAWRRPFVLFGAILVAALLLDLRYNPVEASRLSFTLAEIMAWSLLLVAAAIRKPGGVVLWMAKPAFAANPFVIFWTAWAVTASLAGAFLLGRWEALQLAKDMMPGFIAFLFLSGMNPDGREWRQVRTALLAGLAVLGGLGVAQYLLGGPYFVTAADVGFQKINLDGDFVTNPVTGLSQHPNNFGQLIAPGVAFAATILIHQPWRVRPLLWLAVLLGGAALYASAMKGGLFWLLFAVAIAAIPRRLMNGHVAIALVVAVGFGLIQYSLAQRSDIAGTIFTRTMLWQTAIENLQHPASLLIGADMQQVAADNLARITWNLPHSHMTYLNYALYFGLPALILFCASLYRAVLSAGRGVVAIPSAAGRVYARAILAALLTSAGIALLESTTEPSRFGIVYVMLGLAGALGRSMKVLDVRRPITPARRPTPARPLQTQ